MLSLSVLFIQPSQRSEETGQGPRQNAPIDFQEPNAFGQPDFGAKQLWRWLFELLE